MTAQQAPHTPPMWRSVLSLPRTRLGWLAIVLAAPALVLTVYLLVNQVLGGPLMMWSDTLSPLTWLLSAVAGGIAGLIALARDRSLLVWVAPVPGVIFFAYFVWGISSMSIGHDANPWITAPIAILLWAVMVFNIWMSTRLGRERS